MRPQYIVWDAPNGKHTVFTFVLLSYRHMVKIHSNRPIGFRNYNNISNVFGGRVPLSTMGDLIENAYEN